ncbi:MAG: WYL domain-containing protein [Rhodospirillales bacterium]|nr:WYL domain-containing protein [Rhodospirillales bacterium]
MVRYEKADNLMQLALDMQAARGGLSLADIQERCGVGRRTAMRMRDALLRNFPQVVERVGDDRIKRWHIPPGTLDRLVAFSPDEIADLEGAARLMEEQNRPDAAARLGEVAAKIKALMRPELARRVAPDIEALLEAEGLAFRPGPRPAIDLDVVEALREAIKACRQVSFQYRKRGARRPQRRQVHPYGFLYGHRHYLVALDPNDGLHKLFSLAGIGEARLLGEGFVRDPQFSLAAFARRSFGVFQENPVEVAWRFLPQAAEEAASFVFHPDQRKTWEDDGSLTVRFTAGGWLEMAWHLYTWGDAVEVLSPPELARHVARHRPSWPALP